MHLPRSSLVLLASLACAACGDEMGTGDLGTGGTPGFGGGTGGDVLATGGATAVGGTSSGGQAGGTATGGVAQSGGAGPTGGAGPSGGAANTGGVPGGGGAFGVGGGLATGGLSASGGGDSGGSSSGGGNGGTMAEDPVVFYQELCAECHGPTGDGVEGKGPDIKHPVEDYSTFVIREGRGAADDMTGKFSTLYDKDMTAFDETMIPEDLLAGILAYLAEQPQPTTGEGLYNDYCAACHGADAQGGLTGRPIRNETAEFARLVRAGHAGQFSNRREYMPKWTAMQLSDAEIQLMVSYVSGL